MRRERTKGSNLFLQCVKKILGEKKKIDMTAMKNIIGSLPAYQLNILITEYATIAGRQIEHDIEVFAALSYSMKH